MKSIIALLVLFSGFAFADCFPRNVRYIPASETATGISKTKFRAAIKAVTDAYAADVAALGATLLINDMWSDGTVNSQAYQQMVDGKMMYEIDAFGGLARYHGMTKDAFINVLCHELGHHIGGAPRYGNNTDWAAVEGQADYFSTLRCLKRVGVVAAPASLVLAKVLADLGGEPVPSYLTPDKSKVSSTFEDHPAAQCRLDTYFAGASCGASSPLSKDDPKPGTCFAYDKASDAIGLGNRPRCWFDPVL